MTSVRNRSLEIFAELNKATKTGQSLFSDSDNIVENLNKSIDHIHGLLSDATQLFLSGSTTTSLFLSITAIEETGKLMVTLFRSREASAKIRRGKDPLFKHSKKHLFALQDVLLIGGKLDDAIGFNRVRELFDMAWSGEFSRIRESALYIGRARGKFLVPSEAIDDPLPREILLIALECASDQLTGTTNHSFTVGERLDKLFSDVAA